MVTRRKNAKIGNRSKAADEDYISAREEVRRIGFTLTGSRGAARKLPRAEEVTYGAISTDNSKSPKNKVFSEEPLVIQRQGSFCSGGNILTSPGEFDPYKPKCSAGQTYHGDHLYTFYQVPINARPLPIIMWHGYRQFSKTWETTPDGRDGFQNIFLRRGFPVYLIDQPRRGGGARSTIGTAIEPVCDEQFYFGQFRLGVWPDYFNGVQFLRDKETLNQYFRAMTPDTGPFDIDVMSDAVSSLLERIGPSILFTHSHGGGLGWSAAMKNENIRAIVSFEPGSNFVFPQEEIPAPKPSSGDTLTCLPVHEERFQSLTRIPIIIFYGDYIPRSPTAIPTLDAWRVRLEMAYEWREAVNKRGGDVSLVHLPYIGIKGNTHFPFSDMNNVEIANQVAKFLAMKGLD